MLSIEIGKDVHFFTGLMKKLQKRKERGEVTCSGKQSSAIVEMSSKTNQPSFLQMEDFISRESITHRL